MSLFGKLTKEELERYIQDYLNEEKQEEVPTQDPSRVQFDA